MGIATDRIREGDSLPSVRQLAENIGINMHTVNKAYAVLKQEGTGPTARGCNCSGYRQAPLDRAFERGTFRSSGKECL